MLTPAPGSVYPAESLNIAHQEDSRVATTVFVLYLVPPLHIYHSKWSMAIHPITLSSGFIFQNVYSLYFKPMNGNF